MDRGVFISFIHEEERVATLVQEFIETKLNWEVTAFRSSDQWQIYAGEDWFARIREALKSANVVLLMLSKKSVERPWVNFEAGGAWLNERIIIPICYGGLTRDTLPKPYSELQSLDLKGDAEYLISSIRHHLKIPYPPPVDPLKKEEKSTAPPPRQGRSVEDILKELHSAIDEVEQRYAGKSSAPPPGS